MTSPLQQEAARLLTLMTRLRQQSPVTPPPAAAKISPSLMAIIDFVAESPDCGIKEIARGLKLSAPTVSVSIRQLEEKGFVGRKPNPDDRRAVQIFLTPAGQELHEQSTIFRRQTFERLLAGLTPEERETLLTLLEKALRQSETKRNDQQQAFTKPQTIHA